MQIDKFFLTLFVSALAGFFTAAVSIVKLVNDKESKTTDYRQAWTESLRKSLADLISNINLLASGLTIRGANTEKAAAIARQSAEKAAGKKNIFKSLASKIVSNKHDDESVADSSFNSHSSLTGKIVAEESNLRDLWRNMHQSYAMTRLHFKPNEEILFPIEQKFDVIVEMLNKLDSMEEETEKGARLALREKVHAAAGELTGSSRHILKTEWEAVKKGEKAYQKTKTWSLIGGGVALFAIFILGTAAILSNTKQGASSNMDQAIKNPSAEPEKTVSRPETPEKESANHANQNVTIYPSNSYCSSETKNYAPPKKITHACTPKQ